MIIETEIDRADRAEPNRAQVKCNTCGFIIDAEVPQLYDNSKLLLLAKFVVLKTETHEENNPGHTVKGKISGQLALFCALLVS